MYGIVTLTLLTLFAAGSSIFASEMSGGATEETALLSEARGQMKAFATSLKGTLKSAMREGGPINALQSCSLKAPQISEAISRRSGWHVGRTSLKVRNPANSPDAWEMSVLKAFEQRKQAGENIKTMEQYEQVEQNGKTLFRYMKAIPTGALCLSCHGGEQVNERVVTELNRLYPEDQARGFNIGDIRGAFTLSKELGNSDSTPR